MIKKKFKLEEVKKFLQKKGFIVLKKINQIFLIKILKAFILQLYQVWELFYSSFYFLFMLIFKKIQFFLRKRSKINQRVI